MLAAMQGVSWEDVRLFLALVRARTLGSAAAEIGFDPSTLSRRLAALEARLATRLFVRTPEGLLPTRDAELLVPAAEEMAAAHARFSRDAAAAERVAEGTVRLSVPPGLSEAFIAPALVRLRALHPRIDVALDVSLGLVDLTRREADLAVRTRRPQSGDLVSVRIGARRWTPMIAARPGKKGAPVADWAALPWIAWGDDMESFAPARWVAKHVRREAVVLRTSHVSTQVAAVAAGLGAALLPPVYARLAAVTPARPAAALAPSVAELPMNESWLVGHRALRAVPRVAAVWTFLVEEFAKFDDPR